jgi:hypothetical protein
MAGLFVFALVTSSANRGARIVCSDYNDDRVAHPTEMRQMQRPIVDPLLLVLAIVALAGAAWLSIQNKNLRHDLASAVTARNTIESDARATSERESQAEAAKARAERLLAKVGDEPKEAQRAKEAALLALKQAQDQLVTQKDAIEARLKSMTDELAQTRADKQKAEADAAKAKQDLEQAQTAQKAAEQTPPVSAVTPPQGPQPTTQGLDRHRVEGPSAHFSRAAD